MKRTILCLMGLLLLLVVPACREKKAEKFAFSSGGAYHPSGYGEWQVALTREGEYSISHNRAGALKDFGTVTLLDEENQQVWGLIEAAGIAGLESSTRLGMPDEGQYSFSLDGREVQIWLGDARDNDNLAALVDRLGKLIETYTGQEPVLK